MQSTEQQAAGTQSSAAVAAQPAVPSTPIALTAEEKKWRYEFIGKLTDRNITYPSTNKFGAMGTMTVQDLCNSNVETLQRIAKAIKKLEVDHDPEFDGAEELKIGVIKASEWLQFLKLTIRKKNWNKLMSGRRTEIENLRAQIAQAKTPDELRKEAEAKLTLILSSGVEGDDE